MKAGWRKRIILTITGLILTIPALAEDMPSTTGIADCRKPKSPAEAAICHAKSFNELIPLDMWVAGLYKRALKNTTPGSAEQDKIIQGQRGYLQQRDACGSDTACLMKIMRTRQQQLIALNKQLKIELPDADIALFIGEHTYFQSAEEERKNITPESSLADRILGAFEQYPPAHVKLTDGSTLFWGFQQGNGSVRSLAITDAKGHVQLVGAVDDLPDISNAILPGHDTHDEIDPANHRLRSGRVALFVRDPAALRHYLPAIRGWAYADLLGFNVHCDKNTQWQQRCTEVQRYALPITAYGLMNCKSKVNGKTLVNHCPVPLPNVPGTVPLGLFRQ